MTTKRILTAIIFSFVVFLPMTVLAQFQALSSDQLDKVTAQSGIVLSADKLGIDMSADTIYYGDDDGVGGDSGAGYLSLCGVQLQGSVQWANPVQVDIGTMKDPFGGTEVTAVKIQLSDMTIDIDRFSIDAIRVGSAPGEGKSFGSFGILGMHTEISGNVQIWAH